MSHNTAVITPAFSGAGPTFQALQAAALKARCAVICGVPSMGKSLLLREGARIATALGRTVHRLQWDVARQPFERPDILGRYPEIEGSTHPVIRRAAGLWVRGAVARWWDRYQSTQDLLLIEAPLVGGRFIELARKEDDSAEVFLGSSATNYLVPVPSAEVRAAIQAARVRDAAAPDDTRDAASAIPVLVDVLWQEVVQAAHALALPRALDTGGYSPKLYAALLRQVLRHHPMTEVPVTEVLSAPGPPQAHGKSSLELQPQASEVSALIEAAEAEGVDATARACEAWYRL